jgi:hypothetical protein
MRTGRFPGYCRGISLALPGIAWYAIWLQPLHGGRGEQGLPEIRGGQGPAPADGDADGHVLRNASVPLVQYLPTQILLTIAGSLIIESIYSIPGMGGLLVYAIRQQDNPWCRPWCSSSPCWASSACSWAMCSWCWSTRASSWAGRQGMRRAARRHERPRLDGIDSPWTPPSSSGALRRGGGGAYRATPGTPTGARPCAPSSRAGLHRTAGAHGQFLRFAFLYPLILVHRPQRRFRWNFQTGTSRPGPDSGIFGTDMLGRDMWARTWYGTRTSLTLGLCDSPLRCGHRHDRRSPLGLCEASLTAS